MLMSLADRLAQGDLEALRAPELPLLLLADPGALWATEGLYRCATALFRSLAAIAERGAAQLLWTAKASANEIVAETR